MRLWSAIDQNTPQLLIKKPLSGTYVPLMKLDQPENAELNASELAGLVRRQGLGCNKHTFDSIFTAWVELITNCYAHADVVGPVSGLACAQAWENGNLAQLAIIDPGIGIRASLSQAPELLPLLKEDNACELATRLGISSKLGRGHAGFGLAVTRQLAEIHDGAFALISGNDWLFAKGSKVETGFSVQNLLSGTLVVFEWRLDKQLDISKVYERWPSSPESNDYV